MNERSAEYRRRVARLSRTAYVTHVAAEASPTDEMMIGIFNTALEGGIGYWSEASSYHWSNPDDTEDYKGFYADIHDVEDDDKSYRIDRQVINRGYKLATTTFRNKLNWSTEPPPMVITADTDWDYDAGDADMIVQLGLFGEVVYG